MLASGRAGDRSRAGGSRVGTLRLAIIGATGGTGRQLVMQALASGHRVTAVVRSAERLGPFQQGTRVVEANLPAADPSVLESAVAGADAVLSALGPRSNADAGIAEAGTRAIVQAMLAERVARLVVVSAAPVATVPSPERRDPPEHDPADGFFTRHVLVPVVRIALGKVYADLARMEDVLRTSGLEWTAFRPPHLTNGRLTRRYRTAPGRNLPRGLSVSRADLAHAMLAAIHDPATIRQTVGIAR